jgi:hypothetical protein
MVRRLCHLVACSIFSLVTASEVARSDVFHFDCPQVPFPVLTRSRPIDGLCGIAGDQVGGQKAIQNALKNNLCRGLDSAITTLQLGDFIALQRAVEQRGIKFGRAGGHEFFPDDRAALANLIAINARMVGEGSYVEFAGYMDDPHYADVDEGESVNCKLPGKEMNDIHINLVQEPTPKIPGRNDPARPFAIAERQRALCRQNVVAEIIPHYRPAQWEERRLQVVANLRIPVRVAGQLFFDASHFACDGEEAHRGESLRRASIWEIHPVYSIDVCRAGTLEACPADDDGMWIPLERWRQPGPRRRR